MTIVRILPQASEELEASIFYYESQQTGLGAVFLAELKRTRERILKLPKVATNPRRLAAPADSPFSLLGYLSRVE